MGVFSRAISIPGFSSLPASKPKIIFTTKPETDEDETDSDLVVIRGGSARVINLKHTHSVSASRSVLKETQRTVDTVRIKNPDNPEQHVDVQRPASVNMQVDSRGNIKSITASTGDANVTINYASQPESDNIEVLERGKVIRNEDYEG